MHAQPRYFRRIESLSEFSVDRKILAFNRDYFNKSQNAIQYESLGYISHRKYLSRIFPFIKALLKIHKEAYKYSCMYTFGFDCALLGVFSNKLRKTNKRQLIIYECADIRSIFIGNRLKNKLLRFFERCIMKHCYLIVTTSPAFIEEYYIKIQKQNHNKIFLLENKIREPVPKPLAKNRWTGDRPIVIGYFGLLRCQRSLDILVELTRRLPDKFRIYIRGYRFGINDLDNLTESNENLEYGGTYLNPDDLGKIYSSIDMIWAAYPFSEVNNGNWRWAMTNRFYEACYYKVPLIVQSCTQDAKRVNELQIGRVIDMNNIQETIDSLSNITQSHMLEWENNLLQLPKSIYVDTKDHDNLALLIQNGLR